MRRRPPPRRAAKVEQADLYEIGDELFFVLGNGTAAGEAFYIGHAPGDARVVVLAKPGMPATEFDAAECRPTGHKDPQIGHQMRAAHLKRSPGSIA